MFTTEILNTKSTYQDNAFFIISYEERNVEIHCAPWGFKDISITFEDLLNTDEHPDKLTVNPEDVDAWIEKNQHDEDIFIPVQTHPSAFELVTYSGSRTKILANV